MAIEPSTDYGQQQPEAASTPAPEQASYDTQPEVNPARKALVEQWIKKVKDGEKKAKEPFKQMRKNMRLARLGAEKDWIDGGNYVVPVINRFLNQAVASLYAKNPQADVKLRDRIDSTIWDGNADTLTAATDMVQSAQQMAQPQPGMPPQPGMQPAMAPPPGLEGAMAVVQDAQQTVMKRQMLAKLGKTMKILFNYYLNEQEPRFKKQFKQAVRRAKICGVGYVDLGFQRILQPDPDVTRGLEDITDKMSHLEALMKEAQDGDIDENSAKMEELRLSLLEMQSRPDIIVREGPVFSFPKATEVIVDPECIQLEDFIGAGWLARRFWMTPERVLEVYKVDVKKGYTHYEVAADKTMIEAGNNDADKKNGEQMCCVYAIQDKRNRQLLTVCEGYCDFLVEPSAPDFELERFWTTFTIIFNPIEDEDEIYPPGDVQILEHPQAEYNRARQGLREHRQANRPAYAARKAALSDEDKEKLATRPPNAILELDGMVNPEDKVENILQAVKPVPIDPAVYDTQPAMSDILVSTGGQQANLGGTSGDSATETSIAEQSRMSVNDMDVDVVDDVLTDLARNTGQVMLLGLSLQTVQKIAGEGAIWPTMDRQSVAEEIYLDVRAGSSGRPNKAAELANRERAMPWMVQFPGINPLPIARDYLDLLGINVDDAIVEGLPSIVAMNAMASRPQPAPGADPNADPNAPGGQVQPGTGDPQTDPAAQGAQGAGNAPQAAGNEPQAQPLYPAPVADGGNAQFFTG